MTSPESVSTDFIRTIVQDDLDSNKYDGRVVTRFPPEPNGYLHIGHAKSICLNFGVASEYPDGVCHLRFDDTNPLREDVEYINSIQEDVRWLGFDWGPTSITLPIILMRCTTLPNSSSWTARPTWTAFPPTKFGNTGAL